MGPARIAVRARQVWRSTLVLLPLLAAACASLQAPFATDLHAPSGEVRECARWFAGLDDAVDRAGVRDAGAYRIPGFPYLRVDRFLASFAAEAALDDTAFAVWVEHMAALDAGARGDELSNLPHQRLAALAAADKGEAAGKTTRCRKILIESDLVSADQRALLVSRVKVPDDYSDWQRIVGLYPLVSVVFSWGVETWQEQTISLVARANADAGVPTSIGDAQGRHSVRYQPAGKTIPADRIAAIFTGVEKDALGIPRFTADQRDTLLQAYAPALVIGTDADYDHFGPLAWQGGTAPTVVAGRPAVYRDLAFTRYQDQVLVQLVYTLWFPERPESGFIDTLSGRLDGVVLRITLDETGKPLIYDTIHPCGCYHMFFPTDRLTARPAPTDEIEWAFIPAAAPAAVPPQRISITTQSRTHFVIRVGADSGETGIPYELLDYGELRALPASGGSRSAFGPDGLVPGTGRGERFLFWPMGIDSAGAMREWGRHATAFTGRRHFDSPDLIERRFSITPANVTAAAFDHQHAAWETLLRQHVVVSPDGTESRVDYAALKQDRRAFDAYLAQLSAISEAEFSGWSREQRLAFLINAYNAFTIDLILSAYPDLHSIRDLGSLTTSPWKKSFFTLRGASHSLDDIEHGMIRAPGAFDEPRVHFALVCASIGCPMLRNEAYTADRLDAQLEDGMRRFLSDPSRNRYAAASGTLEVSKIFDWYGGDFAKGHGGFTSVAATLGRYADLLADDPAVRQAIRDGRVPVTFLEYDWKLNDAAAHTW
jgi:hypothetical protein